MGGETVLKTIDLKKNYGSVKAVQGISLDVARGQVFGFLGPNGSGKTTTIGMVLSLIHPTAGSVEVLGERVGPGHNRVLKRVGALVGGPALYPYLSALDNVAFAARLHPDRQCRTPGSVLDMVGLSEAANRNAGSFSTGMKQRLGLAIALVHCPEVLVLDEPTNGMDPAGMREVRELLRGLAAEGTTIFLSSHLLHEVEQICDHIAVLKEGLIVAQGRMDSLLGTSTMVRVRVPSPADAAKVMDGLPGVTSVMPNAAYLEVSGVPAEVVVQRLTANGIIPSEVNTANSDLERVFMELTGGETE